MTCKTLVDAEIVGSKDSMRMAAEETPAWWGRKNHNRTTQSWFERVLRTCGTWPKDSLEPEAIISLVDTLPALSRIHPDIFSASVDLLRAQNAEKAWQKALNFKLAMLKKSTINRADRSGDLLIVSPRRNAWKAQRDADEWRMHDGRTLTQFISRGQLGRRNTWTAAADLPNLVEIEMPGVHLGYDVWSQCLLTAKNWLNSQHPAVRQAIASGRTWKLAVRRIKFLGVRGVFDPISATVIIDPRHPETLLHEMAHWVLGHDVNTGALRAEKEVNELLEQVRELDQK